ncbi:hypothetical protein NDR87_24045 [Nocardia sp. CDC159]|uniref:Mce-associated membrane protein n=1 Tax=Nocardia pulmonis TaxID=2951408 RepID=A0A9X2IYG1_9NOCA|nr:MULTISPECIES: hypothetical protein [Nocardia]MCM6777022.1 hypothetical protein [Nocardia pulmonis]MCM6789446.1 hypothetical protein [Nocardia sp. CDC159]
MSDDDAAKEKPNTEAEATAKADRPQDSTAADVTAEKSEQSAAAEPTVRVSTAPPTQAEPKPAEREKKERSGSLLPVVAAFGAGVLLVAAITAIVVFWKQSDDRGQQLDDRDAAARAACDFGKQIGTYDAKTFDDYVKRVKDRSTGDWLTQFDAASSALRELTTQAQVRSTVDEIHCAWETGDDEKASVLLLITQNQSKAATPQPQHLTIGVVATMEKKDGKWLASSFKSPMMNDLGGPAGPVPGEPGTPAPQSEQSPTPAPNGPAGTQPGR